MENEKKIMVTKSFLPPMEEYIEKIKTIWDTNWLTNQGPLHQEFEQVLKNELGGEVTLFVNGHLALEAALSNIEKGAEVITTPFTFSSTTHAIVRNGLTPVFCDINSEDYTIDVNKIEKLITPKTKAIVPVHVYGSPCDVYKIQEIAELYNLKVIYDAAHVFGVEVDGRPIGTFGDMSMFSMHATKVFHSIEGGVLIDNTNLNKKSLDLFKNFGISGPEDVLAVGINAKMNEFQAAMGLVNLKYLSEEIQKRKTLVELYNEKLRNVKGITTLKYKENVKYNYAYYPIIVEEEYGITRDVLQEKLQEYNIYSRKYFYPLTSDYKCYANVYNSENTPVAQSISDRVLTLPLYSELTVDEVAHICDVIVNNRVQRG